MTFLLEIYMWKVLEAIDRAFNATVMKIELKDLSYLRHKRNNSITDLCQSMPKYARVCQSMPESSKIAKRKSRVVRSRTITLPKI